MGQGRVVEHGPAAPMDGALPMELATVSSSLPADLGSQKRFLTL